MSMTANEKLTQIREAKAYTVDLPDKPPPGKPIYKFADPTEGARWVSEEEAIEIANEDPSLLRWGGPKGKKWTYPS